MHLRLDLFKSHQPTQFVFLKKQDWKEASEDVTCQKSNSWKKYFKMYSKNWPFSIANVDTVAMGKTIVLYPLSVKVRYVWQIAP